MTSLRRTYRASALAVVMTLFLASCGGSDGRNPQIAGVQGPNLEIIGDAALISMVLEDVQIDGGLRYPIPEFANSYIEISPDLQSGGTLFAVSFSMQDLLDDLGLQRLDPLTLPGGRALPGVASGSLPAIAFTIPSFYNIAVYLGPDVFGIFVPFSLDIEGAVLTFRFYAGGSRVGNVSIVSKDSSGENSGLLLLIDMEGQIQNRVKTMHEQGRLN